MTALLVTPVTPRPDGVGVEQRAARLASALMVRCNMAAVVTVPYRALIASSERIPPIVQRSMAALSDPAALLRRLALAAPRSRVAARLIATVSPRVPADGLARRAAPALPAGPPPDLVLAFRLRAAPAALELARGLARAPRLELDLDDLESDTAWQIARVAAQVGDVAVARVYAAHAAKLEAVEAALLPRFDRVWVCSPGDRDALARRFPRLDVGVLPNVVDTPRVPAPAPSPSGARRLLFVGALAYYPNIDAALILADEVMPRLEALAPGRFAVDVVGRGAPRWLARRLARAPGVTFHGEVPAMGPRYAAATAVVVPLRAGGGTRLKILEALAYGVPVVATTVAAVGLDLSPGEHLAVADRPDDVARACLAVADDPDGARAQALRGRERVRATAGAGSFAAAFADR